MFKLFKRFLLVFCLFFSLSPILVYAASYNVYLSGNSTFSDSVNLSLSVSGSASMGGACGGVCGVSGVLNYDRSKIELIAASGLQGFDFTQGTTIVLYKSTAASDGGILSLRFRNVGLASGESTTVSISGLNITNGDIEVGAGSTSKTIQYIAPTPTPTPAPASNPTTTSSQSASSHSSSAPSSSDTKKPSDESSSENQEESKEEEPKEENKEKSKNASLSAIKISSGEIKFNKDILNYDVIVDNDINEIIIDAPAEDSKAKVSGTGTFKVDYGVNEYKIIVTAEDGTEKEYTIKVYRDGAADAIAQHEQTIIILIIIIIILVLAIIAALIWFIIKRKKSKSSKNYFEPTSFKI